MDIAPIIVLLAGGLIVLLMTGIPVAVALLTVGVAVFYIGEGQSGLQFIGQLLWKKGFNFTLLAIPLFIYVGFILERSGLVEALFRMVNAWLGRVSGSLGVVSLLACGILSSMSGSGGATVATIGSVIRPELDKSGFDRTFMAGCLNGGGNLAPLIPPSIAFIVYGSLTDQPITRLFAAGVVPGIMFLVIMVILTIGIAMWKPALAPRPRPTNWEEKLTSLKVLPAAISVAFSMLGGIFLGWYTPTEAASIGVVFSLGVLVVYCKGSPSVIVPKIWQGCWHAARVSAMVILLVVAGSVYSEVLTFFRVPQAFATALTAAQVTELQFLGMVFGLLLLLGMFVDGLTMQIISVPFLLPLLIAYDINLIWFGIFVVVMVELGTLTPPFGIHLFIIQDVLGISYRGAVLGAMPFTAVWLVGTLLLVLFPAIATWLPNLLF